MVSKNNFKLVVVSSTTPFFAFVQIIYFLDCRKVRFRGKIYVFPDKNHLFHCKTAFLIIFFTRKHRFRGKISVFPDKHHLFQCKMVFLKFLLSKTSGFFQDKNHLFHCYGIYKAFSLENVVFDIKFMFLMIKTEFSTVKRHL